MSLMSFLTGASSLFGGGGGGSSGTMSTTQHSTGSSKTAAEAKESSTGKTTQSGTSTGTSSSTGNTSQTGATTGKETSQTTGKTTNYSADVLASLDNILSQQMGSGGTSQQATDAIAGRLKQIQDAAKQPAFDVNGYVTDVTRAATAGIQNDLDSQINSILSATGSSEGGNSMSALLGAKLRNDASANLAGIAANARAQGEQIVQSQQQSVTQQISGLSGDLMTNLSNLLGAARGGTQTTTGAATTASSQQNQQTGSTSSTTNENVATNTTQEETRDTSQTGVTTVDQSGTVSTKSKQSTSDGGGDLFKKILDAFSKSATAA